MYVCIYVGVYEHIYSFQNDIIQIGYAYSLLHACSTTQCVQATQLHSPSETHTSESHHKDLK